MGTDLDLTAGALLLGVLITDMYVLKFATQQFTIWLTNGNCTCSGYGITTTQTYMYMTRFTRDPWFIRGTVRGYAAHIRIGT